mmetsp:Transcript_43099/g.93889  ORF Transcript_43099/g.93889 Transcript_43099/m.93889 type:complete len:214 (+) Transcript_43099:1325-1966(+)
MTLGTGLSTRGLLATRSLRQTSSGRRKTAGFALPAAARSRRLTAATPWSADGPTMAETRSLAVGQSSSGRRQPRTSLTFSDIRCRHLRQSFDFGAGELFTLSPTAASARPRAAVEASRVFASGVSIARLSMSALTANHVWLTSTCETTSSRSFSRVTFDVSGFPEVLVFALSVLATTCPRVSVGATLSSWRAGLAPSLLGVANPWRATPWNST